MVTSEYDRPTSEAMENRNQSKENHEPSYLIENYHIFVCISGPPKSE